MQNRNFILFVAGEDSGDILGENAVCAAVECGFLARGIGGARMRLAGMEQLADFEQFPVSGFFDVLPRALFFSRVQKQLLQELARKECVGLCCVDYPGINMKLCAAAKRLGKRVLYLEPPQVFAWKSGRAVKLQGATLAVFFPFEREAYARHGVKTNMVLHPFLEAMGGVGLKNTASIKSNASLESAAGFNSAANSNTAGSCVTADFKSTIDFNVAAVSNTAAGFNSAADSNRRSRGNVLLLPGSRRAVLKRNLPLYLKIARLLAARGFNPIFVAARKQLLPLFEHAGIACNVVNVECVGNVCSEHAACCSERVARVEHTECCSKQCCGVFNVVTAGECAAERVQLYRSAKAVVAPPGTSLFEATASGIPVVAVMRPDALTYVLARLFLRIENLALPNLLLGRRAFLEVIAKPFEGNSTVAAKVAAAVEQYAEQCALKNSEQAAKQKGFDNASREIDACSSLNSLKSELNSYAVFPTIKEFAKDFFKTL